MKSSDSRMKAFIAVTVNSKVYMYRDPRSCTLVSTARDPEYEFNGFQEFMEKLSAKQIAELSLRLGIRLAFKKGEKYDLAIEMWEAMCDRADDRRDAADKVAAKTPEGLKMPGQRGRKAGSTLSRVYHVIIPPDKKERKELLHWCECSTRQARKIWEFFIDEYLATGSPFITEGRMQSIVNDRQEELNTKQDPWRIFQYYRPELMQCQLVKMK